MTAAKIATITSLEELDGYEAEAKRRGITSEEVAALKKKRNALIKSEDL